MVAALVDCFWPGNAFCQALGSHFIAREVFGKRYCRIRDACLTGEGEAFEFIVVGVPAMEGCKTVPSTETGVGKGVEESKDVCHHFSVSILTGHRAVRSTATTTTTED